MLTPLKTRFLEPHSNPSHAVGEGQGKEAEAAVDPAGVGRVREARGQEVEEMGAGTLRELSFHGCLQGVRWRQMEVEGMRWDFLLGGALVVGRWDGKRLTGCRGMLLGMPRWLRA
eukprot:520187-Pelagomonas_calceolata.AAC.3